MADLVLEWGALGIFGTNLADGSTSTVDTGGVAASITFNAQDEDAQAFTFNAPAYSDGSTNPTSHLKLFGDGGEGGLDDTSTTVIDFSSTDALYTDNVQNLSFRLNDVDSGAGDDVDDAPEGSFQDNVTILAYDADGNPVPVTLTGGSSTSVSGDSVTGISETGFEDESGSVLVEIAGPVSRIEIIYQNGGDANQGVLVSDVSFSTVDVADEAPDAVDDAADTVEVTPITIDVLANDTDPQGDPLTVTGVGTPTNGTATVNPDGTVTYTPDAGFIGDDTFTYTVTDPDGNEDTATVTVTVGETPPPPPPTGDTDAVDDAAETDVDTPVVISVLANDTDPEDDPLSVVSVTDPANGTASVNPDGTVTYTPDAGFYGEDTFDYTITDPDGNEDTATVTVTVGDTDAVDDVTETGTDTPVIIPVLVNDTDPQGDPLDVITATDPANGSATINPDGTITYTPDAGFNGTDTFDYTVTDPDGNTDTATVTVNVGDTDAVDDEADTPVSTPVVIDVLANDTDPSDDPLTVAELGVPANGTAELNPDGTVTYTPDPGFTGVDTFTYTVTDPAGNEDLAVVTVTVGETDAVDDEDFTVVDTSVVIPVLDNDTDPEGDPLTVVAVGDPANGTATINPDGTITYTPDPGFDGTDTFEYTVSDPDGNEDTATVTVNIRDGIVDGTPGDDLIDEDYLGDPNTPPDQIDNEDNIFGGDPDDDIVEAGDGDDTVYAGDGDDTVDGDDGEDEIFGGDGDDSLVGGGDDDTVSGDLGDDTLDGGDGDDVITGGVAPRIDTDVFPVAPGDQLLDPLNGVDEDPDPSDDNDLAFGGAGNDTINTGDDADTVDGGTGDDVINAGIDDDLVFGGDGNDLITDDQGSDTIDGGAGDDTIVAGIDTLSDYPDDDPSLPLTIGGTTFDRDPNPDDGRDYVVGGDGNDVISTGDDADTIEGGADNDTIDAGIDDDIVDGGTGDDVIDGGHGSDTLLGGEGDDLLDGSAPTALELPDDVDPQTENDRDLLDGGVGNDTLIGGDDDDTLIGGAGDDLMDGGIDEDVIVGGDGDDTITGGDGADTIDGGDGRDDIIGASIGDEVDGGSGPDGIGPDGLPNDYDTLDLTGTAPDGGTIRVTYTSDDREDGFVEFFGTDDADPASLLGTMTFEDIENVVPCFTPGTMIATPTGERMVEDLREGDRVITRDNGIQEIRWIGRKDMTGHELARQPHLRPILIRKGALGNGLPEHDLLVSPNHRVLVNNDKTALYFEEREVLAAAKHLTGLEGVDEIGTLGVSYLHFMFDQHEVVLSNGAWTESFQPGDYTLKGIGNAQRNEILELFPELEHAEGIKSYSAARRSLKKHEAKLLVK